MLRSWFFNMPSNLASRPVIPPSTHDERTALDSEVEPVNQPAVTAGHLVILPPPFHQHTLAGLNLWVRDFGHIISPTEIGCHSSGI